MRTAAGLVVGLFLLIGCTGTIGGADDDTVQPPGDDGGTGDDFENTVDVPLDPNADNSSGVTVDGDGNLVLDPDAPSVLLSHIWIANSPEGTVSKIDTVTGIEVARYRSGPGSPDPSRTTVGLDGDVVVANRGGASAVRIHADTAGCPDVNLNGQIDTSTGPSDVLPWGADECVLWYHEFPGGSLARAAAYDFVLDPDGIPISTVWIGLYSAQKLVRLNIATGNVIAEVDIAGHCPYGLAFDGNRQKLWGFSACSASLIEVDVATLAWTARPLPCAYGITVDPEGRVWTSGGGCVARFDPVAQAWQQVAVGSSNRGLAHDGNGSVWVADTGFGVHRLDANTMATQANIPLNGSFVGMAVDFHDKVWAVSQGTSQAYRIDPATHAGTPFPTGANPYTYSDMTGFQLQNAAPPLGILDAVLEGCGPQTQWLELSWEAETPVGTYVRFFARTAAEPDQLDDTPLVPIAQQPDDLSPADLAAALEAARPGSSFAQYLQLEIVLYAATADITPVLSDVRVTATCPPMVP